MLAKAAAAHEIVDVSHIQYAIIGGNFIPENNVAEMSLHEVLKNHLNEQG